MPDTDKKESPSFFGLKGKALHGPRYLQTILLIFLLPILLLYKSVWKRLQPKPFFAAAATIAVIGWVWSWTVTSNVWWSFGRPFMVGWDVIPHLPIEEVLFYPLGGILCIFIYARISDIPRFRTATWPKGHWIYLAVGTVFFASVAFAYRRDGPFYLLSQLITYNFLCCFCLAPFVARRINPVGQLAPSLILGTVGFFWDFYAMKVGLWQFHAITFRVLTVPIDEFNFFLYAPTSAASIYLVYCRVFQLPPLRSSP